MRTILTTLLMLPLIMTAQPNPHELTVVDSVPGASASQLFQRARLWFIDYYKSAPNVVQLSDSSTKTIVGKALFRYSGTVFRGGVAREGHVHYTIDVQCKDGRYRVRLYDYLHDGASDDLGLLSDGRPCFTLPNVADKLAEKICAEEVEPQLAVHDAQLVTSIRSAMSNAVVNRSDW